MDLRLGEAVGVGGQHRIGNGHSGGCVRVYYVRHACVVTCSIILWPETLHADILPELRALLGTGGRLSLSDCILAHCNVATVLAPT